MGEAKRRRASSDLGKPEDSEPLKDGRFVLVTTPHKRWLAGIGAAADLAQERAVGPLRALHARVKEEEQRAQKAMQQAALAQQEELRHLLFDAFPDVALADEARLVFNMDAGAISVHVAAPVAEPQA